MAARPGRRAHWEGTYARRAPDDVSWYQRDPRLSLDLIAATGIGPDRGVVDIGGGASVLVDRLLDSGHTDVAVLDIAEAPLTAARERLGDRANLIEWIVADVTDWKPARRWTLWHDRAVFHFLVEAADRRAYVAALDAALEQEGHIIVATFALDGPERCSGLPVRRYDEAAFAAELGPGFRFVESRRELHWTPDGAGQAFLYQRYVRA